MSFFPGVLSIKKNFPSPDSCTNQFVKLVSATPSQVLALITGPERVELEQQLAELTEQESSEQSFIQAALHDLKVSI